MKLEAENRRFRVLIYEALRKLEASDKDEGQESVWLERFKANAEEASIHAKKFLEWLDKEMPDNEASLKLPYSSEPLPDSDPWK